MWIDTHVHFDAAEFDATRADDWARAQAAGVSAQVIPSVSPDNFSVVHALAQQTPHTFYALGIHPMYVMGLSREASVSALRTVVQQHMTDNQFVAIGEIGLDGFVAGLDSDTQVWFLREQLKIARDFELPVLLHVRRSVDLVMKYLREFNIRHGIAHAFNGSMQQAHTYIERGLHLGFGGVLTHERALNIRRLASELPLSCLVLETDAPDMPPSFAIHQINYTYHLPRIAQTLSELRGISTHELAQTVWVNSLNALPRLAHVLPASPMSFHHET